MADVPRPTETSNRNQAACQACGYEVRGLNIGDDCPECGMPVLVFAPKARGRRPAVASVWLALGAWLSYGFMVVGVIFGPGISALFFLAAQVFGLGAVVASLIARTLIRRSSPRPRGSLHMTPARAGFWIGGLAALPGLLLILLIVIGLALRI